MLGTLTVGISLVLLSITSALAGSPADPVLIYSSRVNDQPVTRSSFADLRNSVGFSGVYYDPAVPDPFVPLPGTGVFYTNDPQSLSGGFSGPQSTSWAEMSAAAVEFQAQIFNRAWSTGGSHGFVNTSSGAARWFVLKGARKPVSLRVDVAFQGTLYGSAVPAGEQAGAFFTHLLNIVAYPSDMVMEYPIAMNGGSLSPGYPCGPFEWHGTVPDLCVVSDGSEHAVNWVVRSNPFIVLPDVPFRLNLILGAAAVSAGAATNEAWTDFRDPGLATSQRFPGVAGLTPEGFVVDVDGNSTTTDAVSLASLGYSLQSIPDPATFFLVSERSASRSTLSETVRSRKGQLTAPVTGSLGGSIAISDLEFGAVMTGAYAGKGFFAADWQATLEGIVHRGSWRGFAYEVASEQRMYLKGVVSGGIDGITEGFLVESVPGSGSYDRLEVVWTLSEVGGTPASGAISITGTVGWEAPRSSSTKLDVLQLSTEGTTSGESAGPLGMVATIVRVTSQSSPSAGRGFAVLSYQSAAGAGEAWTFAQLGLPDVIELAGMGAGPLAGPWHLAVDETASPRVVTGLRRRTDLGLPPLADVEVQTWTSSSTSPGSSLTYAISYQNQGLRVADNVVVIDKLSPLVDFVSSSAGGVYNPDSHEVTFHRATVPPGSTGVLYVTGRVRWGLSEFSSIGNEVLIGTDSGERNVTVSPGTTALTPEWASLQVARADNDWDVRDAPPEYDPSDPRWQGYGPDSLRNRVDQAIDLIRQYDPGRYDHLHALYDKGKIHIDLDLTSSEWNNSLGVKHMYLNGQDVKWGVIDVNWDSRDLRPESFVWLIDLAGKMIHEDRHSDGQYNPASEKGEMQAFAAEGGFHLKVLDGLLKSGQGDRAWAVVDHMDTRWRDLRDRNPGWTDAKALANQTLSDLLYIEACIAAGDYEAARKRLNDLQWDLLQVDRSPEPQLDNAVQTTTNTFTSWDPNAKSGPEGPVARGQVLDYRVEFENVGKGTAFGVYVTDELAAALDESTLTVGPMRNKKDGTAVAPAGTYDPATRTITWLVGQVGPGAGGYADVSVQVKADAPDGEEIINYATIYFPSVPQGTRTNPIVSVVTPPGQAVAVAVGPARLWLGLKNSDDQGTNFDVRAEVWAEEGLMAEGQVLCVKGLTRNVAKAARVLVPVAPVSQEPPPAGSEVTLKVYARIGTTPDGEMCGGHSSAVGLKLYYDALAQASRIGMQLGAEPFRDQYLRLGAGGAALEAAPPAAGTARYQDSPAVRFPKGNGWALVGTWTRIAP